MALFDGTTDAPSLTLEVDVSYLDDFTLDVSLLDGNDPLGPNPAWTELPIDTDVNVLAIRRGRTREDQANDPGELIVELDNLSGYYDPDNGAATNPYATEGVSWWLGAVPVRVQATWDGDTRSLYTGRLQEPVTDLGAEPIATFTFLDGLADAALAPLTGWEPLAETTSERVTRVLDAMGWADGDRDLSGDRELLAQTDATTGLGVLEEAATAEGGRLHVDVDGKFVLTTREDESPKTIGLVLSDQDTPGTADYASLKTSPGVKMVINTAIVSNGTYESTVSDVDSQVLTRTARGVSVTVPLATEADVDGLATYLATRRSVPATRLESVTIDALGIGDAWADLIALDLGDWIQVRRTGVNGLGLDLVCAVEGIEHTISARSWLITLYTAPVDTAGGTFNLDDSLLDGSDLLTARVPMRGPTYY